MYIFHNHTINHQHSLPCTIFRKWYRLLTRISFYYPR